MGYDERHETMEVPYFEGFFSLKTNLWPLFGKQAESVKKKEEGVPFLKRMKPSRKC